MIDFLFPVVSGSCQAARWMDAPTTAPSPGAHPLNPASPGAARCVCLSVILMQTLGIVYNVCFCCLATGGRGDRGGSAVCGPLQEP